MGRVWTTTVDDGRVSGCRRDGSDVPAHVHAGGRFLEAIERRGAAWAALPPRSGRRATAVGRDARPDPSLARPPRRRPTSTLGAPRARRPLATRPDRLGRRRWRAEGSRRRPRDRMERAGRPARELRRVAHPNRDSRSERGLRLTPATRVVSRADLPVVICVVDTPQYRTGWWPAVSPPPSAASSCSVLARSAIDDLPQPPRPALRRPRGRGPFSLGASGLGAPLNERTRAVPPRAQQEIRRERPRRP